MFDLEYNANVGFIPRFAYLESMVASEEDVADVREDLDNLSGYVDGQAGDIAVNAEAIADETAAREEAVAALNERIDSIPAFDIEVVIGNRTEFKVQIQQVARAFELFQEVMGCDAR